ncbi:MAG: ATP-binding protein [Burkholderiaceae bacterium]
MTVTLTGLLTRADALLARVETLLPAAVAEIDWSAIAFRWRKRNGHGRLEAVRHIAPITLDNLQNIARQRTVIERNTRQFVDGRTANNVLLTGARGTGKSSLIKACLNAFADRGLRLIEVDKNDLVDLPDIVDLVAARSERFVIFCDDLSFEEGESSYKALKVALDGSIAAQSDNVLIYATSNRRHLMPEQMKDNLATRHVDGADGNVEIHPADVIEEKISLSERFGLWVSFYPFRQDEYLAVVAEWMRHYGCGDDAVEQARADALRWALERGSRSGRVAHQFARDWAGRLDPHG